MSNTTLTQETAKIKEMISSYEANKKEVKKEMKGIDEKYKKLAEAEKEALKATVAFYDNAIAAFNALLHPKAETPVEIEIVETADEATVEPGPVVIAEEFTEDKVTDNLFPENNEEPSENESEGNEGNDGNDGNAVGEEPEFDGAGFANEDNFIDDNGNPIEPASEEKKDENPDEEEWPDTVEEWLN